MPSYSHTTTHGMKGACRDSGPMLVKHGRISVWATMGYLTLEITLEITTYFNFCKLSEDPPFGDGTPGRVQIHDLRVGLPH